MDDLISRQAALDEGDEWIDTFDGDGDTDIRRALRLFKIGLKRLPSAQPAQRWIPCSERLPKKNEQVLVYMFVASPYIAWHDGVNWCTEDFTVDKDEEPLAWMPLPEPYRKDGEADG